MMRRLLTTKSWRTLELKVGRELLLAAILVNVVLVLCAILFWAFEGSAGNEEVTSFWSGFEWVTRTLLEAASPWDIKTPVGKFLNYVVLVSGVGLVAIATGVIASKLFTFIMRKDLGMGQAKFQGHIVICGWSAKGAEILRELHAEEVENKSPIALLAQLETTPTGPPARLARAFHLPVAVWGSSSTTSITRGHLKPASRSRAHALSNSPSRGRLGAATTSARTSWPHSSLGTP